MNHCIITSISGDPVNYVDLICGQEKKTSQLASVISLKGFQMLSSVTFLIRCELKAIKNYIYKGATFHHFLNRRHLLTIMKRTSHFFLILYRMHHLSWKDKITSAHSKPNMDDLKHEALRGIWAASSLTDVHTLLAKYLTSYLYYWWDSH